VINRWIADAVGLSNHQPKEILMKIVTSAAITAVLLVCIGTAAYDSNGFAATTSAKSSTLARSRVAPHLSVDSMIWHPRRGAPVKTHGASLTSGFVKDVTHLRSGPTADTLEKLRDKLEAFAKISKRGPASVAITLQVVDAFGATSHEEFHNRIAKLPVTISAAPTVDQSGRAGVRRDYFVKGKLKYTFFFSTDRGASHAEVAATNSESTPGNEQTDDTAAGASSSPPAPLARADCDDGDCATQEDIDDAISAVAAMQDDIDADEGEAAAMQSDYCSVTAIDPDLCGSHTHEVSSFDASAQEWGISGPEDAESPLEIWTCRKSPATAFGYATSGNSCAGDGIFAALGVGAWIASKAALWDVVTAVEVSSAGLGAALFGALAAGAMAGYGIGTFINCMAG
jgi:hypothetical protein